MHSRSAWKVGGRAGRWVLTKILQAAGTHACMHTSTHAHMQPVHPSAPCCAYTLFRKILHKRCCEHAAVQRRFTHPVQPHENDTAVEPRKTFGRRKAEGGFGVVASVLPQYMFVHRLLFVSGRYRRNDVTRHGARGWGQLWQTKPRTEAVGMSENYRLKEIASKCMLCMWGGGI